jgi:dTDP-4-amino-4,6-dideoxygalactose transaminase
MIPLVDLRAQHLAIQDEIREATDRVLASARFVLGEEVAAFEEEFAVYSGALHGAAVNSGTSALHLALLAAKVGPGDEVITTPFTFVATVAAIDHTGARPVFVDIDPLSCTIDVSKIEDAITPRTKAIVPVHLYGQAADMEPLMSLARRRRLTVIEDAAQAHGAEYKGRRVGSIGDMGCFSFYPTKNLGACGEGGMVLTADAEHARTIRMLRDWGQERKHHHQLKGYNCRMDALQGAILRVKLRHLDEWNAARRKHAALYDNLLASADIGRCAAMPWSRHVYHVYAVRSPRRDVLRNMLRERGVQTEIHYPVPVHLLSLWSSLGYSAGDFPSAERAASEVLSLPMYPELQSEDVQFVAEALVDSLTASAVRVAGHD